MKNSRRRKRDTRSS